MITALPKTSIPNLNPLTIKLGLENITTLMDRLGNPHETFKSVHIAGTNGKGSTAAFISEILIESGYKTALYTSPHLERFNERIKVDNVEISDHRLKKIYAEVQAAADQFPPLSPTYFEFATAVAFLYFSSVKVEIAVLETGLGGRLDATNVVIPEISVITPISMDHSDYLGDTLEDIAFEKSGIIKDSVPVVSGRQTDEVRQIIEKRAFDKKAILHLRGRDFDFVSSGERCINYRAPSGILDNIELSMIAEYQNENAALAVAVIKTLKKSGINISDNVIRSGIGKTVVPGRFEIVCADPYIVLDCAHNPGGAKKLVDSLDSFFGNTDGIFVVGIMNDKDVKGILLELAKKAQKIILTKPDTERAFDPCCKVHHTGDDKVERNKIIIPDIKEATSHGIRLAEENRTFCTITGSLYTVAEATKILRTK